MIKLQYLIETIIKSHYFIKELKYFIFKEFLWG